MEMVNSQPQDTLRLTPQQVKSIFLALEREEAHAGKGKERRKHDRQSFGILKSVPFEVHEPGQPVAKHLVIPHNLSASGISVLHGIFVNVGTRCVIALASSEGGTIRMDGVVVRCRHVAGRVHEVGIKFEIKKSDEPSGQALGTTGGAQTLAAVPDDKDTRSAIATLAAALQSQAQLSVPGSELKAIVRQLSEQCGKLAS